MYSEVLHGPPAQVIVEFGKKTPTDIIALTSHGRSGVGRWVLGSVTESLVRASGDPALVIPASSEPSTASSDNGK